MEPRDVKQKKKGLNVLKQKIALTATLLSAITGVILVFIAFFSSVSMVIIHAMGISEICLLVSLGFLMWFDEQEDAKWVKEYFKMTEE